MKRAKRGRPRGGASYLCECGSPTRVLRTTRVEGGKVRRERKCLGRRCGARITTMEDEHGER